MNELLRMLSIPYTNPQHIYLLLFLMTDVQLKNSIGTPADKTCIVWCGAAAIEATGFLIMR